MRLLARLSVPLLAAVLIVPLAQSPARAAGELAVTGTQTCVAAEDHWLVAWTVTNRTDQPHTVGAVTATPGAGVSVLSGIAVGDVIAPRAVVTATQRVYDFRLASQAGLTVGLSDVPSNNPGTVSLGGTCGHASDPSAAGDSQCDGSVVVRLSYDGHAPVQVRVSAGAFSASVWLEPGDRDTPVTVPAVDADVQVTFLTRNLRTVRWEPPAGCMPEIGRYGFFATVNSRYVSAAGTLLIANAVTSTAREGSLFTLYDLGSGRMALRSTATGRFVTVNAAGNLSASRLRVHGDAERFRLVVNADQSRSLRSVLNGYYIAADRSGAGPLIADRTAVGPWEKFLQFQPGAGPFAMRATINGRYVSSENGRKPMIANRTVVGPWELFELVYGSDGIVFLQTYSGGAVVTADKAGAAPLIANRTAHGPWERFRLIDNGDGTMSLRAVVNNKIVTAESRGTRPLIANRTAVGSWEKFFDFVD